MTQHDFQADKILEAAKPWRQKLVSNMLRDTSTGIIEECVTIKMVPEGGFEPPTRGFSIRCSTPELLGLTANNRWERCL